MPSSKKVIVGSENSALFVEERQQSIQELLFRQGKVTVDELANAFRVSTPTIRNDLARLEEQGLLRRTHGGAISTSPTLFEPPYDRRQIIRHAEKLAIARQAAALVQEGETLLLDAGTTVYELALLLKERRNLTVVTNSLANAQALMENRDIEVIMVGGSLQPNRRAALGPLAARFLEAFHVDRAFMAFNGIHLDVGFTVIDFDAAEIKRRMMVCATETIVLSDSGKIGQKAFARVAPITAAHRLITDSGIDPDAVARLSEQGLLIQAAQSKRRG